MKECDMAEKIPLNDDFEAHRDHLKAVAYRMLGLLVEADDAVQEAWLRLHSTDVSEVKNLRAWLTTVVSRICLDHLRSRKARPEEALPDTAAGGSDPQDEAAMADSVGLAMLVVLQALGPPERVAFVLHDLFDVPFNDIAEIVGRSSEATRQLASRARRRVQGTPAIPEVDFKRQRQAAEAYLAAARAGDFDQLLAVLDPDVVRRAPISLGGQARGAAKIAEAATRYRARFAQLAVVDGVPALVVAPRGRLGLVIRFTVNAAGKITEIEILNDREQLAKMEVALLA
jgi:RNA polymerase sigma factor (sigma-70 family)